MQYSDTAYGNFVDGTPATESYSDSSPPLPRSASSPTMPVYGQRRETGSGSTAVRPHAMTLNSPPAPPSKAGRRKAKTVSAEDVVEVHGYIPPPLNDEDSGRKSSM